MNEERSLRISRDTRGVTPIGTIIGVILIMAGFLAVAGGANGLGWWSWVGTFGVPAGAILAGAAAVGLSALGVILIERA